MSDGAQQQTIDFARGEQLGLLRRLQLEAQEEISGAAMKAVLRAIDDHGQRCWPAQDTLAAEACVSRRTAQRAIAALHELGLICVERPRRGGRRAQPNVYTIVWSELAARICAQARDASASSVEPAIRPTANATAAPAMVAAPVAVGAWAPCPAPDDRAPDREPSPAARDHAPPEHDHAPRERDHAPPETRPCAASGAGSDQEALRFPPPPSAQRAAARGPADGWRGAEGFLIGEGIRSPTAIVARAQSVGLPPQRLIEAAREILATAKLPPNVRLWRTDAVTAAAYRLARGAWPADGVVSLPEWERREAFRRRREGEQARQRAAGELWKRVQALRRERLDEDQIKARLRDEWPAELCECEGW